MGEQAEIKVTKFVKVFTHSCKCDDSRPSFQGVLNLSQWIEWPVFQESFRISYCPWCGKKLPSKPDK